MSPADGSFRSATWRDRSEYALARAVEAGVQNLPQSVAERIGRGLGLAARSPLGVRLDVVEQNLRRAFPEASEQWVRRIARDAFAHLGREAIAMLRLSRLPRASVLEQTRIQGWTHLEGALRAGRGAILVTGHLGNWELAAAAVAARGWAMDAVVKPLRNRMLDRRLDETRRRLGIGTIAFGDAPRQVPRALFAGHAVGMVADQDARDKGVWVPFFGHLASTHRGPALFALRLGAPLFACSILREEDARYHITVERIPTERTGDLEADVLTVTRAWTERLEQAIRRAPEQYFWHHKRWKTAPPAEHGERGAGINLH